MQKCNVEFSPGEKSIKVNKGQTILEAARIIGIYLNSICGGEGICGKCKVIVKSGSVTVPSTAFLTKDEIRRSYVLACQAKIDSDIKVEIPPETRLDESQILTESEDFFSEAEEVEGQESFERKPAVTLSPVVRKFHLTLPVPAIQDNISDLQRIYRELRRNENFSSIHTSLSNIKKISNILRESNWNITVTAGKANGIIELMDFEAGDTSSRNFGIAVDLGTTTVAVSLVNLNSGETLATMADYNAQASYGEDVITRIIYASDSAGLQKLNTAVVENINGLIGSMAADKGIKLGEITAVVISGNTTMLHLLLGLDPAYIRKEPYVPSVTMMPVIRAAEIGIRINQRGLLRVMPGVSSYVGSDITAGTLACGMTESEEVSLLMDVGTNGEIVIGNNQWLMCCSCSAGPAFEGGGVKCGMRAAKGAIQSLKIDLKKNDIKYSTIGNVSPKGLCGSGLIDALSELLRNKIIDRAGKFDKEIAGGKIIETEDGLEFVLVSSGRSAIGQPIVITQNDIANVIRAKGALYVGAEFLLKKAELKFSDVKKFYIAGGFGNYLDIENAIIIGLLPDLPVETFKFIGNSSLAGAKMALLSEELNQKADCIAQNMTNFELSVEPDFMNEYTSSIFLPHTNIEMFPNVSKKLGWK